MCQGLLGRALDWLDYVLVVRIRQRLRLRAVREFR